MNADTEVDGALSVSDGETSLDVNDTDGMDFAQGDTTISATGEGINMQVGAASGHFEMTETFVSMYAATEGEGTENGFAADAESGTFEARGMTSMTLEGGATSVTLDDDGMALTGDLAVSGDSVFSGAVDIAGPTRIDNTLGVEVGQTVLDVNGSGFNLQVGTNTGRLQVTATSVSLTEDGSGITASNGAVAVSGTSSATISGGGATMALTSSGVSLSGSGGAPMTLSGVADPVGDTDAVNLRTMRRELGSLEEEMSGGIAQSMAMTQLPMAEHGKDFSFGSAIGHFNGETALALGGSARLENGLILRGAASYSDPAGAGAAVGVGWSW